MTVFMTSWMTLLTTIFMSMSSALPRQDEFPARPAEKCSDGCQYRQFEQEPGHDPVGKRPGREISAKSRRRLRGTLCRHEHDSGHDQRWHQRRVDLEEKQKQ